MTDDPYGAHAGRLREELAAGTTPTILKLRIRALEVILQTFPSCREAYTNMLTAERRTLADLEAYRLGKKRQS